MVPEYGRASFFFDPRLTTYGHVGAVPLEMLAQQGQSIAPGDRVRVRIFPTNCIRGCVPITLTGTISELSPGMIVFESDGQAGVLTRYPVTSLERLEVTRGKKSLSRTGAAIGLLAGAIAGTVIWAGSVDEAESLSDIGPTGEDLAEWVAAGTLGGLGGAALGALVGSSVKIDRCEGIPLSELRVDPSPVSSDGLAVSASLRF